MNRVMLQKIDITEEGDFKKIGDAESITAQIIPHKGNLIRHNGMIYSVVDVLFDVNDTCDVIVYMFDVDQEVPNFYHN